MFIFRGPISPGIGQVDATIAGAVPAPQSLILARAVQIVHGAIVGRVPAPTSTVHATSPPTPPPPPPGTVTANFTALVPAPTSAVHANTPPIAIGGPTVLLSAASLSPGASILVQLRGAAPGSTKDWLSIAPVGSAPGVSTRWTYVGDGVTSFDWTTTVPSYAGQWEVRFLLRDGITNLAATSPPFTVTSTSLVPPGMIGPSNTPDILNLELTSEAAVRAAANQGIQEPWAADPQFLTDATGMHYFRFASFDPIVPSDATRLISWFLPFTGRTDVWTRYVIMVEPDVIVGMNELGVKLPGPRSSDNVISWRTEHTPLATDGAFNLVDYRYSAASTGGFGDIDPLNSELIPGYWYVIEAHIGLNTPGVFNGTAEIYVNGHQTWSQTGIHWRDASSTLMDTFHVNFYHGGLTNPFKKIHYRIAKIGVSTSRIGVPAELLLPPTPNTYPAWRQAMPNKDTLYPIPSTANTDNIGTTADVEAWNGFAAAPSAWWAFAVGGHHDQWSNKVFKIDFSQNAPAWVLVNPGSPFSQVPTAEQMDAGQTYYFDGLPPSRHAYYCEQYASTRNRVMLLYAGSLWSLNGRGAPIVDGYNYTTNQYDPAGTWPSSAIYVGSQSVVPTCARHPTTDDCYLANGPNWLKFTMATGTWSSLSISSGGDQWQFHGSVIDLARNRWLSIDNTCTQMRFINLTTLAYTRLSITGVAPVSDSTYGAIVHDLDNDRYLFNPGDRVIAIDPVSGAATTVMMVPAAINAVVGKFAYFQALGGVAYLPGYLSDVLFMPTR